MKKHLIVNVTILLVAIFTVLTSGCDKSNSILSQTPQSQKINTGKKEYKSNKLYIKDEARYEKSFVDGLKAFSKGQKEHLQLIDDLLIVEKEKYSLPSEIETGKQYFFSRKETDRQTELILKRYNLSSLEFNLKITFTGGNIEKKSGIVTLNPMFFLGAESDEDKETGSEYFVTVYSHEDKDKYTYIKIGENENNKLQARVQLKEVEDIPTLKLDKVEGVK